MHDDLASAEGTDMTGTSAASIPTERGLHKKVRWQVSYALRKRLCLWACNAAPLHRSHLHAVRPDACAHLINSQRKVPFKGSAEAHDHGMLGGVGHAGVGDDEAIKRLPDPSADFGLKIVYRYLCMGQHEMHSVLGHCREGHA